MRPLYGRSMRGERCFDSVSGSWKTITMLSSHRLDGHTECLFFDGAVDKAMFSAYMEKVLLPVLKDGDIVVMDNLAVHKNSFDMEKFNVRNIDIRYLPAYSPDLNPIEKMWSKIKTRLKAFEAQDSEGLFKATKDAFQTITASDARGWFKSCGYFQ